MKIGFMKKAAFLVFPFVLLLTGCCRIFWDSENVVYPVITEVRVEYQNGALQTSQQFFRQENIQLILDYLRTIDPYGKPHENPEQISGRNFYITLVYSDGRQRIYQQRGDRYMRIDNGPWKRIDQQKALALSGMLGMMTSDDAPVETEPVPPLSQPQI